MKKLFYKELKLTANPLSYWFIAFSAMTMIPSYPILIGSVFICLGIFYTYQQLREYDDITYTVMLPVKKQDVVTAKYLFVLFIELMAFISCTLLTIIRMKFLGNAAPYDINPLMNANAAYLGYVIIVFAAFNGIFLVGFFKTAYKIGKPLIIFFVVSFIIVIFGEILHHIPALESLNELSNVSIPQVAIFVIGVVLFMLCT
ncbi:ABC-2 transporter permease [Streptococcus mutans]|nr:ABC-2 transporter permease [Streptococcus mutans]MDE8030723.1 ABC-2 transporter permease [Streptococcus mutans]MDT9487495.1 ABC-2 transporter permease [Streptococcus mutans]MDT9491171.1 ABC-2 transporter permease [Streptococcus mutans]MDT9508210.1 ABC-2 transporter permease [Streptococcus mutans]MDT9532088.1 ABC-2 transporter permease [Streptococcus mutans]